MPHSGNIVIASKQGKNTAFFIIAKEENCIALPIVGEESETSIKILPSNLEEGQLIRTAYIDLASPSTIEQESIQSIVATLKQHATSEIIHLFTSQFTK